MKQNNLIERLLKLTGGGSSCKWFSEIMGGVHVSPEVGMGDYNIVFHSLPPPGVVLIYRIEQNCGEVQGKWKYFKDNSDP